MFHKILINNNKYLIYLAFFKKTKEEKHGLNYIIIVLVQPT